MGQAAGVKRRKRRAGNFNILKNSKSQHRRQQHVYKAGLEFLGLEDGVGGKCLTTRISEGGLVANLKHFNKPDPLMFIRQAKAAMEKKTAPPKKSTAPSLVGNVENRRKSAKQKVVERRIVNIPKSQAKFLAYFLDRYGQDYKDMVTDPMNYDQFTWKQFRTKVESFKKSVQYIDYLKDRGLMPSVPAVTSKDDGDDSENESPGEEVETQEEKMLSKIAEMEQEEKVLKKKMTGRTRKASTKSAEDGSDGEDSSEDDDVEQETTPAMALKKSQQNSKRRNRAKKFKVAKRKRLQKEQRKIAL